MSTPPPRPPQGNGPPPPPGWNSATGPPQYPAQQYPVQQYPGQQYPGQQFPGQYGQQFPGGFQPGYGMQPMQQKTNGLSIASFVLSVVSVVMFCIPITAVIAIVFGFVARGQLRNNPEQRGRGLATAGIIIGVVFIVLAVVFWIWVANNTDTCYRNGESVPCFND